MSARILIVDDEPAICEMLAFALRRAEYEPVQAHDAMAAQLAMAERTVDLIVLDWMLPGHSGLELARRWRKEELTREVPIIMLTARGEEHDRVSGLDAGVDDYVVKPFSARELLARIRAVLRRTQPGDEHGRLQLGALSLDPATQRVCVNEAAVTTLDPCGYRLLHFMMSRPERVHSRTQLLDQVWGRSVYIEERTVDVHIRRLRRALAPFAVDAMVQTVRGSGYRLSERLD